MSILAFSDNAEIRDFSAVSSNYLSPGPDFAHRVDSYRKDIGGAEDVCGIAGWVDWEKDLSVRAHIVADMAETLSPRGPDERGNWVSSRAALSHRRLIVIDPEGGKQPMVLTHGKSTFVIVYNGELYNTQELRDRLEAMGYVFRTTSDTEVLLVSYAAWGERCVDYLNGIYAFAVWREDDRSLFMARDRLGVKPLFYWNSGSSIIFASELKAMLKHPYIEAEIGPEGLGEIFAIGPARTPGHGVFIGIKELLPGWTLKADPAGIHMRQYWKLESRPHEDSQKLTISNIRELLRDTVERQLISDVPVCTLLSGGLDSSAITAFASAAFKDRGKDPIVTYSVDYVGNDEHFTSSDFQPDPDAPWVSIVSEFLGTDHRLVMLDTSGLVGALEAAVTARDLPGMADIDSSLYLFSCKIKEGATVALSGECADEILGGYPWFRREDGLNSETFPWALTTDYRSLILSPDTKDYINPRSYIFRRYREALEEVPRLPGEHPFEARIREISYLTLTRWMPVLLDRKDRMSMAAGLEIRVPFCDHRLVEYLWNVPWRLKALNGMEKGILRRAMEGVLPKEVLYRKKSPYPKTHNPDYLAAVRELVKEIISDSSSPLRPLLDRVTVTELLRSDSDFDIPWFGQLMRLPQFLAYLYQVDTWMRRYGVKIK